MYQRDTRAATAVRRPSYLKLVSSTSAPRMYSRGQQIPGMRPTGAPDSDRVALEKLHVQRLFVLVVSTLRHEYNAGEDSVRFFLTVLDSAFGWSARFGGNWVYAARRYADEAAGAE